MRIQPNTRLWALNAALIAVLAMTSSALAQQPEEGQNRETAREQTNQRETNRNARRDQQSRDQQSREQRRPMLRDQQRGTAWLGVVIQPTDQNEGVQVADIYPSGPAARADFRQGDVLLSIDGQRVNDTRQVSELLADQQPDSKVPVTLQRGDQKVKAMVRLANRNDFLRRTDQRDRMNRGNRETRFYQGEAGYSDHSLMLEQHRHLATQHQRIEELLNVMNERLDKLQADLEAMKKNR